MDRLDTHNRMRNPARPVAAPTGQPAQAAVRPSSIAPMNGQRLSEASTPHSTQPFRFQLSRRMSVILGALATVTILGVIWLFFIAPAASRIDGGKYQALFLTNGEVYFGKLHDAGAEYMTLTDVYYVQPEQQAATETETEEVQGTSGVSNAPAQLLKLGNEVHGPTDEMIVRKDQILYFENLKTDGQVAKLINQDKGD